jgi:hypothetical protein
MQRIRLDQIARLPFLNNPPHPEVSRQRLRMARLAASLRPVNDYPVRHSADRLLFLIHS